MTIRSNATRLLISISFIFSTIILGSNTIYADGYESDFVLIEAARIQSERRALEFSEWTKDLRSNDPQMIISLGHSDSVNSIAFSPDGHFVLSGSSDKTIKLWNTKTGKLIQTIESHSGLIESGALSPDGHYILSGSYNGTIELWNLKTGVLIHSMHGHTKSVKSIAFSPDGSYAISGSKDKTLKLWNIETGKLVRTMEGHGSWVSSVAFSPDGRYILSGSFDKTIKIWNVETGRLIRTMESLSTSITSVTFSPDGNYILSGSYDGVIEIWDVETGVLFRSMHGHSGAVNSITFSPDGHYVLSGSNDATIKLWDIETGKLIKTMKGHYAEIHSVAFSPDGYYALSGSKCYNSRSNYITIALWNLNTGKIVQTMGENFSEITSVVFSSDNHYILTGSGDKTLKLWNAETGALIRRMYGHTDSVESIAISSDSHYALSGSADETIKLWDIETGKLVRTMEGHGSWVTSVAFSPDGHYILSGSWDNTIKLWSVETGSLIRSMDGHTKIVESIAFSPDGRYVLSGSRDETIKLWNVETGRLIRTMNGHSSYVTSIAFSSDGRYALSGSADKTIKLWNIETGQVIRTMKGNFNSATAYVVNWVNSVAFSPDGHYILSGSVDNTLKLWNVETGRKIRTINGHSDTVNSVMFSPDGRYALSGSRDGTQKLWSIPEGKLIYTALSNSEGKSLVWTPDGYFSGSDSIARETISIVDGLTAYSIDQFFDSYYRPDIIQAKIAGKDITKLVGNNRLVDDIAPTPEITIEVERTDGTFRSITSIPINYKITNGKVRVKVSATDQGGGSEEIRLFHNGVRAAGITRGISVESTSDTISQTFTIQLIDGKNTLRALAFTTNRIESTPAVVSISYTAPKKVEPTLWVLAVGINEYKNGRYNLNYAVNDAESFVGAVKKSGESLFKSIEATLLTDKKATRLGIIDALETITDRSKPEDVFMFFYAGHGIALESAETERTEFFFIPTDVTQMTDLAKVMDLGLAGPEFEILVSSIPARKQFLVLDACNSGAINSAFGVRGAAEEIALSRLSRATGSALIAASRDDQFAQEFAALGQGALTKALLDGLGGDAALANGQITVGSLKGYVESALPGLTEEYAGQAQYPTGFVFGQDFPIGVNLGQGYQMSNMENTTFTKTSIENYRANNPRIVKIGLIKNDTQTEITVNLYHPDSQQIVVQISYKLLPDEEITFWDGKYGIGNDWGIGYGKDQDSGLIQFIGDTAVLEGNRYHINVSDIISKTE